MSIIEQTRDWKRGAVIGRACGVAVIRGQSGVVYVVEPGHSMPATRPSPRPFAPRRKIN